jgi:hypothetical protein
MKEIFDVLGRFGTKTENSDVKLGVLHSEEVPELSSPRRLDHASPTRTPQLIYCYVEAPRQYHTNPCPLIEGLRCLFSFSDASAIKMHRPSSLSFLLVSLLLIFGFTTASAASSSEDVSILINEVARANNESLLWGPYKPNLYFGVHPRHPMSLFAGLMWAKVDNFATAQDSELPPLLLDLPIRYDFSEEYG